MRFIVYGAGAVGGVVGGRLFEHGHDVVLIARGRHLEAIRERGLRLESPGATVTLPVPAAGRPADVAFRPDDVVILAMKTQDTAAALSELLAAADDSVAVVCMQNGVENERLALRRFANVYATSVMLPAVHLEPGVVQANSGARSGILDTGRYPAGTDDVVTALTDALERSNISAKPNPTIMRFKYTKLLLNLSNAYQAACPPDADGSAVMAEARQEAIACYRAAGIDFASDEEDRERRGNHLAMAPINGKLRGGGSTWQSLARATGTSEADYLNGEIALLGRTHGVATPVNNVLQRASGRMARTGAAPGSLPLEVLVSEIEQERLSSHRGAPGQAR